MALDARVRAADQDPPRPGRSSSARRRARAASKAARRRGHPAVLTGGLSAAIAALARACRRDRRPTCGRLSSVCEATAYFTVSDATNVARRPGDARHGEPVQRGRRPVVEIRDD
jgi:hypothetical protein